MSKEKAVWEAVEPIVTDNGCEVVDVEFKEKGRELSLTLYIDKKGGVTLDDCERVHNAIDSVIDGIDPSEGKPYTLNVSSPGLDRPFKRQRDYERNYNTEVEIKLYAPIMGKKLFEGVLVSRDENITVIAAKDSEIKFENNRIAFVRPLVKFE